MIKKILIIIIIAFCSKLYAINSQIKQYFWGVQGEVLKNIIEKTTYDGENTEPITAETIKTLQEDRLVEIKNTLAAFGYFKPSIQPTSKRQGKEWRIDYAITPGPLLKITTLDIQLTGEGLNDKEFQILLQHLPIHQGDVLRSKYYQEAKTNLVDLAAQRGYFQAKIEQSNILIDLNHYRANVIIHFNTGPRYHFGEVIFTPCPYSTHFLKRFVPFQRGKYYLTKKVVKLQENLGNSTFFQQVSVTPLPDQACDLAVPIEVTVIPRKSKQYTFGAGYGSDTGLRGMIGVQFRRLNRCGHHLEAIIQASQRMNHAEANYSIPGKNPVTDLYRLSVAAENQHLTTSGKSNNEKIEASQIKTIFGWQQTLSLSLRDEHSVPTDGRPMVNSTMLLPNLNWTRVKSNDLLDPDKGYQINFNIRGATRALISNTNFVQALLQTKALLPISENTRFLLKGQVGYTLISDVDELPISLQFYTGGAQTVRGYQFQEIGPGKTLLMGSVELQQRIKGNIYAAMFADAGTVSGGLTSNLKKSVGIGLLWRSPIGAMEITLAQALDNPGQPRLIQFSMGPLL